MNQADNTTWFKRRKHDRIAKIVSAIVLTIALMNLHDMLFLLAFFYVVAVVGLITVAVELHKLKASKMESNENF